MTSIKVVLSSEPTDFSLLSQVERETLIRAMIAEYPDLPESIFGAFVEMELARVHDTIAGKCEAMTELVLRQILETKMVIPILPTLTLTAAQKRALSNVAAAKKGMDISTDSKSSTEKGIAEVEPSNVVIIKISKSIPCFRGNMESIVASGEDMPLIALKILPWDQTHIDIKDKPINNFISSRAGIWRELAGPKSHMNACELFQYLYYHIQAAQSIPKWPRPLIQYKHYQFGWTPPSAPSDILARLDCVDPRDVMIRNLDVVYNKMLSGYLDAAEPYEQMREFKHFIARLAKSNIIAAEMRSSLLNIIRDKLGEKEYLRIASSHLPGDKILSLLGKTSADVVKTEYDRQIARANAIANNKCPHVAAILKFERAGDIYSFRALKEFMPLVDTQTKLLPDEIELNAEEKSAKGSSGESAKRRPAKVSTKNISRDASGMIQCARCKFDMICPHTVEMISMRNFPQNEIATAMQKYITETRLKDNYYCKICGAAIFSVDMFSDLKQTVPMENEELKSMQWGEIASIIRYLKFNTVVNTSHFITLVRDATYKYISELEKQILKSKTTTADEIKAKKRLYATIYGYAYIIMIIMSGKYGVGFRDLTPRGNPLLEYLKHAIELIIATKNIIIKTISGFSNDLIKNQLISAYKTVTAGETILMDTGVGELEPTKVTVRYDPAYWYIYDFTIRDELINGRKIKGDYYTGMMTQMNHILSIDVNEVDSGKGPRAKSSTGKSSAGKSSTGKSSAGKSNELTSVYERVRVGDLRSWQMPVFDKMTTCSSQDQWTNASRGFIAASYKHFLTSLHTPVDENLPDELFTKLEEKQNILDTWRQLYHFHGFSSVLRKVIHRLPEYWTVTQDINRIFDESGRKHIWNILLVSMRDGQSKQSAAQSMAQSMTQSMTQSTTQSTTQSKQSPTPSQKIIETNLSAITSAIESGKRFDGVVVDRKCSVCGIKKSNVTSIDPAKIRARLHEITSTQNFFRWFENRCPEGGHHIWDSGKCTACGIELGMFSAQFSESAQGYRSRYSEKFATMGAAPLAITEPMADLPDKYAEEYANYSFDFNVILTLAGKLKINHKLIMALGAFEKTAIGDIKGTFIPPEITFRDHPRVYIISAHIKNMFTWYNIFRGYAHIIKPPPEITAVITELGLNYSSIGIMDKLPAIFLDYNARQDHFYRMKKPRNIIEFQLQSLCEKLLLILDGPEVKLRRAIVDFIMRKILQSETMLTRPGDFNWVLVYPDSKITVSDENYEADKETRPDDDEEEESSPFSMNAFDIEEEDPDDEDVSNQIRVGENLGLE